MVYNFRGISLTYQKAEFNGIAYDKDTDDYYFTGKKWDTLYRAKRIGRTLTL